ncbi:hypothetical protein GIB67_011109 [Kingdonia uniflora]|uniref:non-specific serine/threonine protein kinase n=1 Tax=Kingdonia uniflora TaxID=39325 RepID=A0A7J7PAG0_9MAGN|nr:hypothetical protein GIB67_011109 [Kingdonia uniflora]
MDSKTWKIIALVALVFGFYTALSKCFLFDIIGILSIIAWVFLHFFGNEVGMTEDELVLEVTELDGVRASEYKSVPEVREQDGTRAFEQHVNIQNKYSKVKEVVNLPENFVMKTSKSQQITSKVAVDVAEALEYLHHDCRHQILHLDIKPENILLDDKFRAVVSDFGLSELMEKDNSKFHTKMTRGSAGYMAPEWYTGNGISKKCDIYSYGKVLLDMFFGQRNVCFDQDGNYIEDANPQQRLLFHTFMLEKLRQMEIVELIDKRLVEDDGVIPLEAYHLVRVALSCLEEDPKERPSDMREVVDMLRFQGLKRCQIDFEPQLIHNVESQNEYIKRRKAAREVPREFLYEDLETATNNFRDICQHGGSGTIFEGILDDGTPVAVKRVEQGKYAEFEAEISAIGRIQHVHIVRLCGYCSHITETGGVFFIVYDHFSYGSLDSFIFNFSINGHLSWNLRFGIALGVAKALAYLHHDCRQRILHLDLKPENILLDQNFLAVVTNFGLSELMKEGQSTVHTMSRGSDGYMAPEWLLGHGISEKSVVFSYGKVLLDMCFGRKNISFYAYGGNSQFFLDTNLKSLGQLDSTNLMELIDQRLVEEGKAQGREACDLVHLALSCLDEDPKKRPDIREVVDVLEHMYLIRQINSVLPF